MSGNLFKDQNRLSLEEYKEAEDYFYNLIYDEFRFPIYKIPHLIDKESFGDLDFLIDGDVEDYINHRCLDKFWLSLNVKDLKFQKNDNRISYLVPLPSTGKLFSLELIFHNARNINQAILWYSYGGLGRLINYFLTPLQYRFVPEGFIRVYVDSNGKKHKIPLLNDDSFTLKSLFQISLYKFLNSRASLETITKEIMKSPFVKFSNIYSSDHYKNLVDSLLLDDEFLKFYTKRPQTSDEIITKLFDNRTGLIDKISSIENDISKEKFIKIFLTIDHPMLLNLTDIDLRKSIYRTLKRKYLSMKENSLYWLDSDRVEFDLLAEITNKLSSRGSNYE